MRAVGLDLGTTKVACTVIDTEHRSVIRTLSREHDARIPSASSWEVLQDPLRIEHAVNAILAQVEESGGYDAICISGQMHGMLYVDERFEPVSPLFSWLDARGGRTAASGASYASELSERTGYRLAAGYGVVTHYYNVVNGLVPEGAAGVCTIVDWYAARLCGSSTPRWDPTLAASFGMFDLRNMRFDEHSFAACAPLSVRTPDLVPTGTLIGKEPRGRPVYGTIGDNQASFLGSVRDIEGAALVNVGTGGQVSLFSRAAAGSQGRESSGGVEVRPFADGSLLVGAAVCSGRAYSLLEELFREVCREFTGIRETGPLFEKMNLLASGAPAGLTVDTRFNGTRLDPGVTGSIEGITLSNLTVGSLTRGFIGGIAEELARLYDELLHRSGSAPAYLVGSGNAVRRNAVLRVELERRIGLPLRVPLESEEAALGAALCAAVGAGAYSSLADAGAMIAYEP